MTIKPTVGRVVWFFRFVEGFGWKGPCAAHIAFVHSDSMVNLMVIDENGVPRSETSVPLEQETPDEAITATVSQFCTWMPYQKGQAAKTEALEKGIAANL